MTATLVGIDGPAKGKLASFDRSEVLTLGREPANDVAIEDSAVSRRHCVIKRVGGIYKLSDLKSRNGTFLNGVPVRDREIQSGDQIRIGTSTFLFYLASESPPAPPVSVRLEQGAVTGSSVTLLRMKDALYADPAEAAELLPSSSEVAQHLNALLAIGTALQQVQDLEALQRMLLEKILDIMPADRAAIVLLGKRRLEFESTFALQRDGEVATDIRMDSALAEQVLKEGAAMVEAAPGSNDAPHFVIAVRLLCLNELVGILYADTVRQGAHFAETHLPLLAAIGSIAGLAIANTRRIAQLEADKRRLLEEIDLSRDMVGESAAIHDVCRVISRIAPTNATVLITGESGTGKELVARAIHRNSRRAAQPFVAVNCAAITEGLLESEMFGHERGAFTGAVAPKKGKFEIADGGTLFLDEIGEMSPALQAKLLRVLQEHVVDRVGSTRPISVDVRIIAASNRDIEQAAAAGTFRQDLFYRLNVVKIRVPALRERREDIPLLARYFAVNAAGRCNRKLVGISEDAMALLVRYDWPGNVRELEHAVERAVILGVTEVIMPEDLPEGVVESAPGGAVIASTYQEAINHAKRDAIAKALEQAKGVYTEAARLLGVHPVYLHRLMRKMNLKSELKPETYK